MKLRIRLISVSPEHDPLKEARGMINGFVLSALFWAGFWLLYLLAR